MGVIAVGSLCCLVLEGEETSPLRRTQRVSSGRTFAHMSRHTYAIGATAAALAMFLPAGVANAAATYQVTVTCTVPKSQPERQLAPNHCLN